MRAKRTARITDEEIEKWKDAGVDLASDLVAGLVPRLKKALEANDDAALQRLGSEARNSCANGALDVAASIAFAPEVREACADWIHEGACKRLDEIGLVSGSRRSGNDWTALKKWMADRQDGMNGD